MVTACRKSGVNIMMYRRVSVDSSPGNALLCVLLQARLESAPELRVIHATHVQRVELVLNTLLLLIGSLRYPPFLFSHNFIEDLLGLVREPPQSLGLSELQLVNVVANPVLLQRPLVER